MDLDKSVKIRQRFFIVFFSRHKSANIFKFAIRNSKTILKNWYNSMSSDITGFRHECINVRACLESSYHQAFELENELNGTIFPF